MPACMFSLNLSARCGSKLNLLQIFDFCVQRHHIVFRIVKCIVHIGIHTNLLLFTPCRDQVTVWSIDNMYYVWSIDIIYIKQKYRNFFVVL